MASTSGGYQSLQGESDVEEGHVPAAKPAAPVIDLGAMKRELYRVTDQVHAQPGSCREETASEALPRCLMTQKPAAAICDEIATAWGTRGELTPHPRAQHSQHIRSMPRACHVCIVVLAPLSAPPTSILSFRRVC